MSHLGNIHQAFGVTRKVLTFRFDPFPNGPGPRQPAAKTPIYSKIPLKHHLCDVATGGILCFGPIQDRLRE